MSGELEPANSELSGGLFRDLTLWIADRFAAEVAVKQVQTELEAIFALHLIKAGWEPASVAARAGSFARLLTWRLVEALKKMHHPGDRIALARRTRAIAVDARKIQSLSQNVTVKRYANRIAKEIRQVAARLDWREAAAAAELFERLRASGKQAMVPADIEAVAERLDRLTADLNAIADAIATPFKPGRPRASRVFGLSVELLAQSYFRDTGKLPGTGVRQAEGRAQGDFFELVDRATKGSYGRPRGRNALAKAVVRVLNTSPRVPGSKPDH